MGTEAESQDTKKAMAYDLLQILKKEPEKTYTYNEISQIIEAYISGTQK